MPGLEPQRGFQGHARGDQVATAAGQHTDVVPGGGEARILLQRRREERLRAGAIVAGHAFGAAVVVEVGQRPRGADRLRAAAVIEHVAVQVDRAAAPVHHDGRVHVAHAVDHALVLVLVPGHHPVHLLHACLDAGFARQGHEQQGEGQAVGPPLLPDFGKGVRGVGVVLQVQAALRKDHVDQGLRALVARARTVDHLLLQHLPHRRGDGQHLLGRGHRRGCCLQGGQRRRRGGGGGRGLALRRQGRCDSQQYGQAASGKQVHEQFLHDGGRFRLPAV